MNKPLSITPGIDFIFFSKSCEMFSNLTSNIKLPFSVIHGPSFPIAFLSSISLPPIFTNYHVFRRKNKFIRN